MTQPSHVPLRELAGEGEPWRQCRRHLSGRKVHQPRPLTLREGTLDPGDECARQRVPIGQRHTLHPKVAPGVDVD